MFGRRVPALTVSGACLGTITVDVTRATPGGTVELHHSDAEGTFLVPSGSCADTVLDLANPLLFGQIPADETGAIQVTAPAPAAICGRFIQVIDMATCTPSNVAQLP